MITDNSEKRNARYANMRAIKDFGMGFLYIVVAVLMFFPNLVGFEVNSLDPLFTYIFGGICILYGGFRIYRGFKKEYFR